MRISDWSSDVCSSDLSVVVAEPTDGEAVLAHRGISSVQLRFKGQAGHASGAAAMESNALHQAMRWGARALDFVEGESHRRFGENGRAACRERVCQYV